ncbi:MAG TPA: diacylglycerol kinase [Steroidobacteraceae bacterium]|nr:diacylglycerol kinase [Steroidobacteraceae bacterium]
MPLKNQPFPVRLGFALRGLGHALRTERSVQLQAVAAAVVLLALLKLRPSWGWWALAGLASAGVIAAELLNTAIETLADHLHPDLHPRIRLVKDCAAAAVLVAVLGALGVAGALALELLRQHR